MAVRVMEAVPNFSEGRDRGVVEAIVDAIAGAGAEVLDWSADPDHNRCVVTMIGAPEAVERAAAAGAAVAVERIDLTRHRGVHPRIGALDVLPFVPLVGVTLEDARASAHRVGRLLAGEHGIPVYFYGEASDPPGRPLHQLRRGGFETLAIGWPEDRVPDLLPPGWPRPGAHPTAGATCVGARPVLLAWNLLVEGLSMERAGGIAGEIRERGGGFRGVRALALKLERRGMLQISMNVEDLAATSPMELFRRTEELVEEAGGRVVETEVVGMLPDALVASAGAERIRLSGSAAERLLSARVLRHIEDRSHT